jgi:hypothetical protein
MLTKQRVMKINREIANKRGGHVRLVELDPRQRLMCETTIENT